MELDRPHNEATRRGHREAIPVTERGIEQYG